MKNTFSHRFSQGMVAIAGMLYLLTGIALLFAPIWFFQHVGTFPVVLQKGWCYGQLGFYSRTTEELFS